MQRQKLSFPIGTWKRKKTRKKKHLYTKTPQPKHTHRDTHAWVFVCFVCHFTQLRVAVHGLPHLLSFLRESHCSSKSSSPSTTLHQGWRLPGYQRCISWSDKALALVPTQRHPIINKSGRKEAFVTVYLDCFSSSPLISSSENWCTLKLKLRAWQVMVSVITAQISSATVYPLLSAQLLELSSRLLDYLSSSASDKNAKLRR